MNHVYLNRILKLFGISVIISLLFLVLIYKLIFAEHKISETIIRFPSLKSIDIMDSEKFLNDLMLSPYWKVEKSNKGFIAKARSIASIDPFDLTKNHFLFELFFENSKIEIKNILIQNDDLKGDETFSSISIEIIFYKPSKNIIYSLSSPSGVLQIYDEWETVIGLNSYSTLIFKLSSNNDIYLVIREQGKDISRKVTIDKLISSNDELNRITSLPKRYSVKNTYSKFYRLFFKNLNKEYAIERYPNPQERDTFYGYLNTKSNIRYDNINIKVLHPIYCPNECTRKSDRLEKSEFLGQPYTSNDMLFFCIEDNAIYLFPEYDKYFGWFSGTQSFDATLQLLNSNENVLINVTQKFKGWER